MRGVGRVACMECIWGFRWESQKERDHQEDQDVAGWIILEWILEKQDRVVWIWLRIGTSLGLLCSMDQI
jgi:hypothetical protein